MRSRVRSAFGVKSLAVLIFAVLAVPCLGEAVQAVLAPVTPADCALCSEQSGCGASAAPLPALPAAALPVVEWIAAPTVSSNLMTAPGVSLCANRPVVSTAPRSPPLA